MIIFYTFLGENLGGKSGPSAKGKYGSNDYSHDNDFQDDTIEYERDQNQVCY